MKSEMQIVHFNLVGQDSKCIHLDPYHFRLINFMAQWRFYNIILFVKLLKNISYLWHAYNIYMLHDIISITI